MLTGDTLFPSQDIEEDLQDEILNMDLDFPDFLEQNEVVNWNIFNFHSNRNTGLLNFCYKGWLPEGPFRTRPF